MSCGDWLPSSDEQRRFGGEDQAIDEDLELFDSWTSACDPQLVRIGFRWRARILRQERERLGSHGSTPALALGYPQRSNHRSQLGSQLVPVLGKAFTYGLFLDTSLGEFVGEFLHSKTSRFTRACELYCRVAPSYKWFSRAYNLNLLKNSFILTKKIRKYNF